MMTVENSVEWLTSTLASDAADGRGVLPSWVRPVRDGLRIVGYASTATIAPDDNLAVRQALTAGPHTGPVLVVGGGDASQAACMGDLVARALTTRGFTAVVTDGLVRDVSALRGLSLAVWARGVTPRAPHKNGPTTSGEKTTCGGVDVEPGDLVIADDDGVVVWPRAEIADLLQKARGKLEEDDARAHRLAMGGALDDSAGT